MTFGAALAPLDGAQIDWTEVYRQQRLATQFSWSLLVPLSLLTLGARFNMPSEPLLNLATFSVTVFTLSVPHAIGKRLSSDKARALWLGPLTAAGIFAALLPSYLGISGVAVTLMLAMLALIICARRTAAMPLGTWLLLLGAAAYLAFELGGDKYANFFADRLALFGRTDGDIFSEGAIVGSIRSYGWPSYGIDGLAPLKYHVGAFWLAGRLNAAGGGDYITSVVAMRIFVLVPLLIFAALQAAILFHAILRPDRSLNMTALIGCLGLVIFVFPYAGLGFATFKSETMSAGAILALLVFPGLYLLGSDRETSARMRHAAWAVAALAFFLIGGAKISMAFVIAFVFAWWLLRTEGLKSLAFWLWGGLGFLAFLAAFLMFSDRNEMGSEFFGTPYYVEYGFARGDWWIPVTYQIETIAALALLGFACIRSAARRLSIETLIAAAIAGNLPGLLMYIQSGNAAYFLVSQAWVAIPVLTALLPGAFDALRIRLRRLHRLVPVAGVIVAVLAAGYASYGEFRTRTSLFLAANALLRSGDLSYFADDKARARRADAKRAVAEFGLGYLLTAPAAVPPGEAFAEDLRKLRKAEGPGLALYVPNSNTAYWDLVVDCDAKSVFPVAEAGLAMIQGYVPRQADCPQEFALRGFGQPPEVRPDDSPESICLQARDRGFQKVAWLETLDVTEIKLLDCAAAE